MGKRDKPKPSKCRHVDVHVQVSEHMGITKMLVHTFKRCRDCGETWSDWREK